MERVLSVHTTETGSSEGYSTVFLPPPPCNLEARLGSNSFEGKGDPSVGS